MLRVIALQCPQEAGLTIDRAKGMLPDWDVLSSWPDNPEENGCQGGDEERRGNSMFSGFDLSIAPDPASNFIKVKFLSAFSGSITIFNTAGKPVLSSSGLEQQTELTLQVRQLPTGVPAR